MNTVNRDRETLKRLVESYGKQDVLKFVNHLNEGINEDDAITYIYDTVNNEQYIKSQLVQDVYSYCKYDKNVLIASMINAWVPDSEEDQNDVYNEWRYELSDIVDELGEYEDCYAFFGNAAEDIWDNVVNNNRGQEIVGFEYENASCSIEKIEFPNFVIFAFINDTTGEVQLYIGLM